MASARTLMALGLAAGVSGAEAKRAVPAVAGAAVGAGGGTAPLGRIAASLAGAVAAGTVVVGAAEAGTAVAWACAAAGSKAPASKRSNRLFTVEIRIE